MNKHLKPGVAVDVRGASDEDVQAVIDACVELGAIRCVDIGNKFVKWAPNGRVWLSSCCSDINNDNMHVISINQALGRESEVEKNDWANLGYAGETPKVDQECEYIDSSMAGFSRCKYIGVNSVGSKKFAVLFLPSVGDYVESKIGSELKFRPLKTEKEKFVDRARELEVDGKEPVSEYIGRLFDNGARFIDVKA